MLDRFEGVTMRKGARAVLAVAMMVLAAATPAEEPEAVGPNPFTDRGPGAVLFPETPWAAAATNVVSGLGTIALSSASISPHTTGSRRDAAARFVLETYESVVEDVARGGGDHFGAVLDLYGCSIVTREAILAAVRPGLGRTIAAADYASAPRAKKVEQLLGILTGEIGRNFAGQCAA